MVDEMVEATNKRIERDRLLSSEEDDTIKIQYHRLPIGIWFVERLGVLSRIDPVVKKKWYVVFLYTYRKTFVVKTIRLNCVVVLSSS